MPCTRNETPFTGNKFFFKVLPWKKNIFFTHRLKRKNNFSELYFYWENDEKIMEKSVFICQMIHVCVIGGISQSSC